MQRAPALLARCHQSCYCRLRHLPAADCHTSARSTTPSLAYPDYTCVDEGLPFDFFPGVSMCPFICRRVVHHKGTTCVTGCVSLPRLKRNMTGTTSVRALASTFSTLVISPFYWRLRSLRRVYCEGTTPRWRNSPTIMVAVDAVGLATSDWLQLGINIPRDGLSQRHLRISGYCWRDELTYIQIRARRSVAAARTLQVQVSTPDQLTHRHSHRGCCGSPNLCA